MLTQEYLKSVLDYDGITGAFYWRSLAAHNQRFFENRAGSVYGNGYRYIQIDGKAYRACRLAWLYVYGELPSLYVEHRNTNFGDDRIDNLRLATNSQNQANRGPPSNNTSGIKGVRFEADRGKWVAKIMINGRAKNLGRYYTKEEAALAYAVAAEAVFGEFARHSLSDSPSGATVGGGEEITMSLLSALL